MRRILFIIICVFSSLTYGSSVSPTFNGSRSPWLNLIGNDIPIYVDSGTEIGLTNSNNGTTPFDFMFIVCYGNLSFGISNVSSYPVTGGVLNMGINGSSLFLNGIHNGAGSPIMGIDMIGDAYVHVYEKDIACGQPSCYYEEIGSFTVGNPVPELSSIILLSLGVFGIRGCRN